MKYGSRNENNLHETGLRLLPKRQPRPNIWKYIVLSEIVLVLLLALNLAMFKVQCAPLQPASNIFGVICSTGSGR